MLFSFSLRCFPALRRLVWLLPLGWVSADEPRPPLEQLLKLNEAKVFGGSLQGMQGDHAVIHFKSTGQFERGFECQGLANPDDMKGHARNLLASPLGGELKDIAAVGRGDGEWRSRFDLAEDVRVSFTLRIPAAQKGALLVFRLNQSSKAALQTSFFQEAALIVGGKARKKVAGPKELQAPPEKWLNKKAVLHVDLAYKQGQFTVKVNELSKEKDKDVKRELASMALDEAGEASGGKLDISFRKLSFVISDLKIEGNVDRQWCEGQLKELEAKGALVLKEKPPPKELGTLQAQRKKENEEREKRRKEAEAEL